MFASASVFNQDISGWDVSNVTDISGMLSGGIFNQDISGWDVSNVTAMGWMFSRTSVFNQDISGWDVSSVISMQGMFNSASAFNQDIDGWDVSSVTDMSTMFRLSNFNQNIGGWDVSNVRSMKHMFNSASAFNQNIGNWDVGNVTNMYEMFREASVFNQNIGAWDVSSVTDMGWMFVDATLSTVNYDALLNGWAAQTVQNGVNFRGGGSKYSPAGEASRNILINTYGWNILDAGVQTCFAPTEAATEVIMGTATGDSLNLISYTAPTSRASGYAVYVNSTDTWAVPNDGDEPTADLTWNNQGQQCIYFGTSVSPNVSITNLSALTTYYFKVYAYAGCSIIETYDQTGAGASQTTEVGDQTISFSAFSDAEYGDADFAPTATASSNLTVTFTTSDASVATIVNGKIHIVDLGTCTIYANQAGNVAYNAALQQEQSLTVTVKELTIAGLTANNKTYDGTTDANLSGTATLNGVVGSEEVSIDAANANAAFATASVGTATNVTATGYVISGADVANYTLAQPSELSANITTAELTVTAQGGTRGMGEANPDFVLVYEGFVNSEDESALTTLPVTATTANMDSPNGTYDIIVSGGEATNYSFVYVSGTLSVGYQTISFSAISDAAYGDADFAPTATASSNLTVTFTTSDANVATIANGKIHIVGIGTCTIYADQAGNDAYTTAPQQEQSLTITAKELTVDGYTASNKTYDGTTDASLSGTPTLNGVVGSDEVSIDVANASAAFATASVGTAISVTTSGYALSGADAANYTLAQASELSADITTTELTVTAQDTNRKVGEVNPDFVLVYEGFVNSEDKSALTTLPVAGTTADQNSPAGTYDITVSGGEATNYGFVYVAGTLTVADGVGIEDMKKAEYVLYPNPAVDFLTIDNIKTETVLQVFHVSGKLIETIKATEAVKLNISDYSAGMYIIHINNSAYKFTKQ